jgi:hypothetical protein
MSRYTQEYDEGRRSRYFAPSAMSLVGSGLTLLGGLAVGAGIMYLLDPDEGPGRRKYIRKTAGGLLHSAGDAFGSAYESVSDTGYSLRDRVSDLAGSAGKMLRRSRDTAQDYVEEYTGGEEEGVGTGLMLTMILGGSALAAVAYMLATEYDSIRQGDFRGAATHAYQRASDAVSSGAQYVRDAASQVSDRAGEYMGRSQEQGQTQQQT